MFGHLVPWSNVIAKKIKNYNGWLVRMWVIARTWLKQDKLIAYINNKYDNYSNISTLSGCISWLHIFLITACPVTLCSTYSIYRHHLCGVENEVDSAAYWVNTVVVSVNLSNHKTSDCTIILLSFPTVCFIFYKHMKRITFRSSFLDGQSFLSPVGRRVRNVGVWGTYYTYLEDDELDCWH